MVDRYMIPILLAVLAILILSFLINLMIILIHLKQPSLRKGFFIIIMVQIIMEAIINFISLLSLLFYCFTIHNTVVNFIVGVLFNFGYVTLILYNIRIVFYLMTLNQEQEESKNYDTDEDDINTRHKTIVLDQYSFKSFHIFCFFLSFIHTILYSVKIYIDKRRFKEEKQDQNWRWFFYYISGYEGHERFAFYIFHIIFFIISIPYLFYSFNKSKISEHIYLKRFSLYCIFSAIISLLFPISLLIYSLFGEQDIIFIIILVAFLSYVLITSYFRVNCYYIQYILEENGKRFLNKCKTGLRILFCCKKISPPNFVDLTSSFIYHSLANINDFLELNKVDSENHSQDLKEIK